MGNVSVKNETPDYYSFCLQTQGTNRFFAYRELSPYDRVTIKQDAFPSNIYIRYGRVSGQTCLSSPMLKRDYNGKDKPTFYIRPSGDKIRLVCDKGGHQPVCDNLGERERRLQRQQQQLMEERSRREKLERERGIQRQEQERRRREEEERRRKERIEREEEQRRREALEIQRRIQRQEQERRRREEEERRRRERIERERQIQRQISQENDALRNKLGRAAEKRRLSTSLSGREHQRSTVIAQTIEDDAEGIQYAEKKIVEKRFQELLDVYDIRIQPDESDQINCDISVQIRQLLDTLVSRYCVEEEVGMNIWFHASFDEITQFNACSMTDQLEIDEALLKVILEGENADLVKEIRNEVVVSAEHALMIRLMASLEDQNRALSTRLFGSCLDVFAGLSPVNKEYMEQLIFNNIWTPLEAIVFVMHANDVIPDDLTLFLHKVCTYRIDIGEATAALKSTDRMNTLQDLIDDEEDKLLTTVVEEMRKNGVPENILKMVQKVVEKVVPDLQSCKDVDISDQIEDGISSLKEIDFDNLDVDEFSKVLLGLCIGVKQAAGYFPRVTQLVSLVTLLLSKTSDFNGCLLQIGTGEGKSCIIAMLAVILAIRGSTVDIVTSSPVLAVRDAETWDDYYRKFNLTARAAVPMGLSTCKTPDQMDEIIASVYEADIVYGTIGNFAADTLRQEFEKKEIRGSRGYDAVIVDEVDFMTLDNGIQVTFLSHASGGMRHVEQVLASIWSMACACRPVDEAESGQMYWCTNIQHFHKAVVSALVGSETNDNFNAFEVLKPGLNFGFLTTTDFEKLQQVEVQDSADDETKKSTQSLIDNIMSKIGVPEERDLLTVVEHALDDVAFECYSIKDGKAELFGPKGTKEGKVRMLLLDNGLACELLTQDELVDSVKRAIEEKIKYSHECTPPDKIDKDSDGVLYIPQFLKPYIQNRMKIFIRNALTAILMSKGREYTIDRSSADDSSDSSAHHFDCIIPVDFKASGVLEKNKRWGDGLQQFLEMKHQLALTPLSTVTNYLSNFSYFKRYSDGSGVYGASGTLGDKSSCDFLRKHFRVSCYPIPTHKHKKLIELPMVQVEGGEDAWIEKICQKTKEVITAKSWCKGQAALVVCEDMKTADNLQSALNKIVSNPDDITMYTRNDNSSVEKVELTNFGPGCIIIATNLGGRGTDFSVTEEVNDSGGLFVLLTHFPSNRRVEKQIFGRTARKGRPGVVQMILNYHTLARAYQGQGIDTMGQLREDYERERIANMENDELLTIETREKLFVKFCERLATLTATYKGLERQDSGSMAGRDLSTLFRKLKGQERMDYKPAQNSFKETWAQWLVLNEDLIEENEDTTILMKSLERVLDDKEAELQQGISSNFYDHTRQAIGRMYLHEADRKKDFGTIASWDRAIQADNAYKSIALYNKAYIVINMEGKEYMNKAIDLLKETIKSIDVHIAENANTMTACYLANVNGTFVAHNQGETNFNRQLEIRKSFFKIWLDHTEKAIENLQKLNNECEDAITEEKSIFALIENPNHLEANELQELFNEGLQVVYEVKKKPKFCIDALICAILGVLQVFAGVLVCALSFGSASTFGLGLISEGVSDIIAGVEGMIKGTFDWAEWAISKAISIGLSLVSAGFSKIKDAACAVAKGIKGVLTGAKSLSSVADDCIKVGKKAWTSTKSAFSSAASSLSKETLTTLTTSQVAKDCMKNATKYAVQEVCTQGVLKAVNVGISKATEEMFAKLLSQEFNSKVGEGLRQSSELNDCLVRLVVCFGVPETALKAENPSAYVIPSSSKTLIHRGIKDVCEQVVPGLTTDNAVINEVFSRLKQVKDECETILRSMDASGKVFTAASIATEVGSHTAKFVTMLQNIPTKEVMRIHVVPELKEAIDIILEDGDAPTFKSDGRSSLKSVLEMKEDLFKILTEKIAAAFTDACASNLNSFLTDFARSKLNKTVTGALHNITGRYETQNFFKKQQEQYHNQKMQKDIETTSATPISNREEKELIARVDKIESEDTAPSVVELKAMVASDQLGGKGLEIEVVDTDGKTRLTSHSIPGSDSSKGTIKLRITREDAQIKREQGFFDKIKTAIFGKGSQLSGHIEIVSDDGEPVTRIGPNEENTLFYAVARATHRNLSSDEVKEKASFLRSEVGDEILKNPEKYVHLHRRQKEYENSYGESTFFSLPPSSRRLQRQDATIGKKPEGKDHSSWELERRDATVKDNSFTMTKTKMFLKEKSTNVCRQLQAHDKAIVMFSLEQSILLIRKFVKTDSSSEDKDPSEEDPSKSGTVKPPKESLLLYVPSRNILQVCRGQMNPNFVQCEALWSQGMFVSMTIPIECEDQILASTNGAAYGISQELDTYEIYRKVISDCLCGTTAESDPTHLMKLAIICSHPDSTQDLMEAAGLIGPDDPRKEKGNEEAWGLSNEGVDAYFKVCFLIVLSKYKVAACLNEEPYQQLVDWVEKDGFLDSSGLEYAKILDGLKAI